MPYKDKEFHAAYRKKRYDDNVQWMRDYKVERGCADCGYNAHHAGLAFDHLYDKSYNVSRAAAYSRPTLLLEIAKCEVVCGTCHGIRSFDRAQALLR